MIKESELSGPCPNCGESKLKMTNALYSEPLLFTAVCENCDFSEEGQGELKNILEGEDAVRARPHIYVGCDDPKLSKLAEQLLANAKEERLIE